VTRSDTDFIVLGLESMIYPAGVISVIIEELWTVYLKVPCILHILDSKQEFLLLHIVSITVSIVFRV